jgi:hypothetical protein
MPGKPNPRNYRNNPYVLDPIAASVHHTTIGMLWRFRTEIAVLLSGAAVELALARAATVIWSLIIFAATIGLVFVLPWPRRFVVSRAWCVITRHRLQRVFYETRMHSRSGRVSPILRIRPTKVGERAWVWCRAGICFEDLEAHVGEIAAACYAREARVERSKRWAQLVSIDVVRRDTLAPHTVIASGLVPTAEAKASAGTTP